MNNSSNCLFQIYNAAAQGKVASMLDLDGATIYHTPTRRPGIHDPAEADPELDAWAQTLIAHGGTFGINTGRPQKFIENVLPELVSLKSPGFFLSTETGARLVRGDGLVLIDRKVPDIDALRLRFQDEVTNRYNGAIVEDHKVNSLTMSFKGCDMGHRFEAYSHGVRIANEVEENVAGVNVLSVWKGEMDAYIEILPSGINKGTSARHMLQDAAYQDKLCITIGDSKADEDMATMVRAFGGIAIGVGDAISPEVIDMKMDDVSQARAVLKNIADIMSGKMNVQQAMVSHGSHLRLAARQKTRYNSFHEDFIQPRLEPPL